MYTTVTKATFIVSDIINPIIKNSKKSTINTTSLSHSKTMKFSGNTHITFISFPITNTIHYIFPKNKRTQQFLQNSYHNQTIYSPTLLHTTKTTHSKV